MTKTRLEAFSDGVLAIIITIMVLELKTPEGTDWESVRRLLPVLGSYILSFVFIGIYWGNHHHLLHTIHHVNGKIMWANMHLLFWLSLVPFATVWMGENNFKSETVAVYGALYLLCGFAFNLLQVSMKGSQIQNEKLEKAFKKTRRKGLISFVAYALSVPLAFVHPAISGFIFISVAVMWVIPDKNIEQALKD
ncbi:MAG: DUF1211 domain-containing protein [Fimbriimonadaceae bacterium]|nr:DUF1211 domain-containing protein [Chitinophagales bacterium]